MIEDFFDKAVRYIGSTKEKVFFVSVGAMDGIMFDEICGYANLFGFKGLYVEPIPYLYDRLKSNISAENNFFENSAISYYDGELEMLTIDKEAIDSGELQSCFYGMSAVYPPKNGLSSAGDEEVVKKYGRIIKVPCLTFDSLLKKHNITSFDILKMDAEGHDWSIMDTIDLSKHRPSVIRIEWINLSDQEKKSFSEKMKTNNYIFEVKDGDVTAITSELFSKLNSSENIIPEENTLDTETCSETVGPKNCYKVEFKVFSTCEKVEEIKTMFSEIDSISELVVNKIYSPEKLNFENGICSAEDFVIKITENGVVLEFDGTPSNREKNVRYITNKQFSECQIKQMETLLETTFDSSSFYSYAKLTMQKDSY